MMTDLEVYVHFNHFYQVNETVVCMILGTFINLMSVIIFV